MSYNDKPEPGLDYMAYLVLTSVLTIGTTFWQVQKDERADWSFHLIAIMTLGVLMYLVFKAFRDANNTRYYVEGDILFLRRGKTEKEVALNSIRSVEHAGLNLIPLTLGIGGKDFCNRLTDVVRIKTSDGKFYLSPSNPQLFISQIRGLTSVSMFSTEENTSETQTPGKEPT